MKILFAIKSIKAEGGGAERVLVEVLNALAKRNFHIDLVTFDEKPGEPFYLLDDKITLHCLSVGRTTHPATWVESFRRILQLWIFFGHTRPSVAIGFMHSMYIPLSIAALGRRVPVVASEHIVPRHYKSKQFEFWLVKLTSYFVEQIIVVSEQVKRSYPKVLQSKMSVIPNPVVIPKCEHRRKLKRRSKKYKTLLAVGRLEGQKQHIMLIKTFATIASRYPFWNLRIIGEGSLRPDLESLVASLDLRERVKLPGATKDIFVEYSNADLFVMPSLYESFGLAAMEALLHKLPVIGFNDCAGINESVSNMVNGILVDASGDKSANLAKALSLAMSNPKLLRQLSRENRLPDIYNIKNVTDQWVNLCRATIRKKYTDV